MKTLIVAIAISLMLTTIAQASEEIPTKEEVAKLYVATFNRAPDNAGLMWWTDSSNLKLSQIAQSFFDQNETKITYPDGTTNRNFIQSVYKNLFNREPDNEGLNYWEDEINSGKVSKNVFIMAVINGAKDDSNGLDKTILSNKTTVGLHFADAGLDSINDAKAIMSGVSSDISSVASALNSFGLGSDEFIPKEDPNIAPIAHAGKDQIVYYTDSVSLSASSSIDSDGDIVSYIWKDGNDLLSNDISFTKDDFSVGTHTITLTVTDEDGESSTDQVQVEIFNSFTNMLDMKEAGTMKSISSSCINSLCTVTISAGSNIYFKITNNLDREFIVTKFEIVSQYNGSQRDIVSTTNSSLLNNGTLKSGESINLGYTLKSSETANRWIGTYYLTDVKTGEMFSNSFSYTGSSHYFGSYSSYSSSSSYLYSSSPSSYSSVFAY
jgi:hypothetical protein